MGHIIWAMIYGDNMAVKPVDKQFSMMTISFLMPKCRANKNHWLGFWCLWIIFIDTLSNWHSFTSDGKFWCHYAGHCFKSDESFEQTTVYSCTFLVFNMLGEIISFTMKNFYRFSEVQIV